MSRLQRSFPCPISFREEFVGWVKMGLRHGKLFELSQVGNSGIILGVREISTFWEVLGGIFMILL